MEYVDYLSIESFDIESWCKDVQKYDSLSKLLKKQEGYREWVYMWSGGKKTVGYGHNMERGDSSQKAFKLIGADWNAVFEGNQWLSEEQCEMLFCIDMRLHYEEIAKYIDRIEEYPNCVKISLTSILYQFGGPGFNKYFIKGIGYIQDALDNPKNYEKFANRLKDSALGKYKSRCKENADLIINWCNK